MKKSRYFIYNSKAQITLFMLIAILILLAGLFYFFYQRQFTAEEAVLPEVVPIKSYIDNCIRSVTDDGLETIGLSGGYINIPAKISQDPRAYLTTFPLKGFKMPYWWYDGIEAVPTEDFIKQQLIEHVKKELKVCLDNFNSFKPKFEVNELKEQSVEVLFNDNDVSINVDYPLEVIDRDGTLKTTLKKFIYTAPIRFKKVYELAKLIMERENKDYFLELKTIDLISMDREIPTTDVEATCKTKIWLLDNIKEKLKTLLRVNLPYIRIKGTEYNSNLYVPNPSGKSVYSQTYFQYHYIWEINEEADSKYKNMKVEFTYDNWPMEIYARPSENRVLRSNSQKGTDLLSFFCLHIWHFTYDISYPVVVTILDKETARNKNYQFNFAFKASIDHNQPDRVNKGTTLFDTTLDLTQDDYCNALQNEITIFTVNNATGEDIRDVNLTFVCGRYYCDMGQSNWLSFGAAAGITKRFPYCVNGIIKGAKQGFDESKSFIQTDVDGRSYVLLLNPIREIPNYKVVKHSLSNPSVYSELAPNEKASILIKGKDVGFEGFAVYPKEADFPLRLPDGKDATYEVNVIIVDDENIIGGYIGDLVVKKDDLKALNEIVFHAIVQESASEDERFLFVSGLGSYSANVPSPELR